MNFVSKALAQGCSNSFLVQVDKNILHVLFRLSGFLLLLLESSSMIVVLSYCRFEVKFAD